MTFRFGRLGHAVVAAAVVASSAASQSPERPERLVPQKIAENLYVLTGAGANVTALVTADGVVVVDSGNYPVDGGDVVRSLGRLSAAPIRHLVYTHYHNDHVGGGAGFPPTTLVVSHPNTRRMVSAEARIMAAALLGPLERRVAELRTAQTPEWKAAQQELDRTRQALDRLSKQPFVFPQVTFDSRLTLHVGGDEVHLLHLGPGHTDGDVMVYFPRQRVLHIGDLLFTNNWPPRLDGDAGARVDNWLKILDEVARLLVDEEVLLLHPQREARLRRHRPRLPG